MTKRLSALEAALALIVEDDDVQGAATFRGTRILVRTIVAALQRGRPV